jgi:hypothetical protein
LSGNLSIAYGAAFLVGALGLAVALVVLRRIHTQDRDEARTETAAVLAGALD